MSKYFITGSAGFVGKHLLERLHGDTYLFNRGQDPNVVLRFQPDYIYHLAAEIYKDEDMVESNILLTHKLLEAARQLPDLKGFVTIGSSSEYGRKKHPTTEKDFLDPLTMYEATKGAATLLCQTYARSYGVPVVIARPYSLYGKHEPIKRFIPTIIRSIKKRRILSIAPGVHDFIHIDDFIDGLFLIADKGKRGGIYNFGTGVQTSNEELVKLIEHLLNKTASKNFIKSIHDYDSECWVSDSTKARKLGWQPNFGLMEGLTQVLTSLSKEEEQFKFIY